MENDYDCEQNYNHSNEQDQDETSLDPGEHKVYVSGLAQNAVKQHLFEVFSKHGLIQDITVFNREGYSFAFVHYKYASSVQSAVSQLDGTKIQGRKIKCAEARPRGTQPKSRKPAYFRYRGSKKKNCFGCKQAGHKASACPDKIQNSNAQSNGCSYPAYRHMQPTQINSNQGGGTAPQPIVNKVSGVHADPVKTYTSHYQSYPSPQKQQAVSSYSTATSPYSRAVSPYYRPAQPYSRVVSRQYRPPSPYSKAASPYSRVTQPQNTATFSKKYDESLRLPDHHDYDWAGDQKKQHKGSWIKYLLIASAVGAIVYIAYEGK